MILEHDPADDTITQPGAHGSVQAMSVQLDTLLKQVGSLLEEKVPKAMNETMRRWEMSQSQLDLTQGYVKSIAFARICGWLALFVLTLPDAHYRRQKGKHTEKVVPAGSHPPQTKPTVGPRPPQSRKLAVPKDASRKEGSIKSRAAESRWELGVHEELRETHSRH